MKLIRHLEKLRKISRKSYHPLLHKLHKKHKISRKTLFYVKEYGPHTNIPRTIIKESIKVLLLASLISSFGGLALENIKFTFVSIIPIVILLPTLNGMIGSYGTIIASRFSTMLYEGKVKGRLFLNKELSELFMQVFIISIITTFLSAIVSLIISKFSDYPISLMLIIKILSIALVDVILLVTITFFLAISAGLYFYKKGEDPNNFLIPITTSFADFGNMILLAFLITLFF